MALFKKIIARVFIWTVLALMYLPILIITVFSFSKNLRIDFSSFRFGFNAYVQLFQNADIGAAVANTLIIAVISSLLSVLIAAVACIGIMAMKRRSRNLIMSLNQLPIINADIVTALALLIFFSAIGFANDSLLKLILVHILISMPFVMLTLLPRFRQLDPNLFEAGQDLGATPTQSLFKVVIPQMLPAMVTAFFLGFTLSLDDFMITAYNTEGINTISTLVYSYTKKMMPVDFRALSAIILVLAFTILIVYNIRTAKKRKKEGRSV